jgi:succinate dehydrogenase / fumarate reductase membrane anchor subunit
MSALELKTPLKRARGWGSARSGTRHFILQRVTAVALVPLALWLLWIALRLARADYVQARALVHDPLHALLLTAFVLAAFWHAQLGVQVVIEDYVHTRWLEITLQLAVKFLCALGALASVLAIVRIALG